MGQVWEMGNGQWANSDTPGHVYYSYEHAREADKSSSPSSSSSPGSSDSSSSSSSSGSGGQLSAATLAAIKSDSEEMANRLFKRFERAKELHNIGMACLSSEDNQGKASAFGELVDIITDPAWAVNVKEIQKRTSSSLDNITAFEDSLDHYCLHAWTGYSSSASDKENKGDFDGAINDQYLCIKYDIIYQNLENEIDEEFLSTAVLGGMFLNRGNMYKNKGDITKANVDFQRAVNFADPSNQKYLDYLKSQGVTQIQTTESLNANAQAEYDAGHYTVAEFLWQKAGNTSALNQLKKEGIKHTYSKHAPLPSSSNRQSAPQRQSTPSQRQSSSSATSNYPKEKKKGKLLPIIIIVLIVIFGGRFAMGKVVQFISNSSSTQTTALQTATITQNCNFRRGPSTNDGVIRELPQGASVTLTGETSGTWTQITHNNDTGWVSTQFLNVNAGQPAARQTSTSPAAATNRQQTPAAPVISEGIYLIRPRVQVMQGGTGRNLYIDRIEVSGQNFSVFYTGSAEGRGGDGEFYNFWSVPGYQIILENLDNPGQTFNRQSQGEDDDTANPRHTGGFYNTFQRVSGTRFRLSSTAVSPHWIFEEIILGQPQ